MVSQNMAFIFDMTISIHFSKLGANGKPRHKKCNFKPPMKGLSKKSINGSAEKHYAVRESGKSNV